MLGYSRFKVRVNVRLGLRLGLRIIMLGEG